MPEEAIPEAELDYRGARDFLDGKVTAKRREVYLLERVAELVRDQSPLGDLYAETWAAFERDKSSVSLEVAIVAGAKLEIAEAIAVAYLDNKVKFATEGPRETVEAIIDEAEKDYFRRLTTWSADQPSPPVPSVSTLIAGSESFAEFKIRAGDAVEAQVAADTSA